MRLTQIWKYDTINKTEESKVVELMNSIRANGYVGCPILVFGQSLLTGSHRLEALTRLYDNEEIDDIECAEDVSEIVEEKMVAFEEEYGYFNNIEYDNIGWLLEGTEYEKYKQEINEW